MKNTGIIVFVVLCLVFGWADIATAGVYLHFNYQGVTEIYIKLTYEFGTCFISQAKVYPFSRDYSVEVLEGRALIRYGDRFKEELAIAVFINKEKSPFILIKNTDLEGETEQQTNEKIKEKAKEFSKKVFQRLLQMEREKIVKRKSPEGRFFDRME